MKKYLLLLLLIFPTLLLAQDKVRFATVFTDNMVLEQKSTVKIWGYANPSEKISLSVSWTKENFFAVADNLGKWIVKVKTPKASFQSCTISVFAGNKQAIEIKNILIGEVWLCSGQSNMEMVLLSMPEWNMIVENSAKEIEAANYPYIRALTVGRKESFTPQDEITSNGWKICTPENAKWFSAVAYFFGKNIHQKLNVPVGLLISSYGGSPVQSWIPENVIDSKSIYNTEREDKEKEVKASKQTEKEYVQAMSNWIEQSEKTSRVKQNENIVLNLPVNLEKSKIGNQLGEVSFSKEIIIPENDKGKDLHISLGRMDDLGRVYFNGELVWEEIRNSKSYSDIQFIISAEKVKSGKNTIEAKVLNILWGGGLTGPADKMYYTIGENHNKISLAGDWDYTKIFDLSEVAPIPREGKPTFLTASTLYNGMINPLLDMTFKGCLWYQGEGNVGDNRYAEMFGDMIVSWRQNFKQKLPFYYVQIAPYSYDEPQGDKSVLIRNQQAEVEKMISNTYMTCIIDLGESENIHPAKKKQVGERLANSALSNTYHKKKSM